MLTTLQDSKVATALDRMYAASAEQFSRLRENRDMFDRLANANAQERADALSEFYLPVTPDAGRLLYSLVRATRPARSSSLACRWAFPRSTSPRRCATTAAAG